MVKIIELIVNLPELILFNKFPVCGGVGGLCYPSSVIVTLGLLDSHSLPYGYESDMHLEREYKTMYNSLSSM